MAMKQVDPSVLSTNSVLDALNSDHGDEELAMYYQQLVNLCMV